MAAPVPPGAPRPGYSAPPPPNYTPNYQRSGDSLAENMQNVNINRQMPNSAPTRPPPPFGQSSSPLFPPSTSNPSTGFSGTVPVSRPVAPPGAFARPSMPPGGPSQSMMHSSVNPGRPSGPPNMQPSPFASRPPPGSMPHSIGNPGMGSLGAFQSPSAPSGAFQSSGFASGPVIPPVSGARPVGFGNSPMTTGPIVPPLGLTSPLTNGPPMYGSGGTQQPPVGPPPTMHSARAPIQAPQMRSVIGGPPTSAPPIPGQLHPPFSTASQGMPPPPGSPYASQAWPVQQRPGMYGMQPPPPNQSLSGPHAMGHPGTSMGGLSKIDPNQIPRPLPNSPVVIYETRQGNQASPPPPATSEYIVKDTGNCSPRYMRCTIHQIPCTNDLLTTSGMPLALLVQPLALPHPSEEPIRIVDFGESGPMRCSRCKGYVNPFMKFIDQGKRFICNLCGFTDETPREYHCNLGPDGRRRDADERPELCRGTVEFVASKEYMVREPMPAVFFFLIDVSMNAIQTGATAAACSAISQVIADLPEGPRTMVGVATFDVTIHFYNLKRALQQPLMLIVPDIQDVYTPLQTDIIVQLSECRQHMEMLLENIPSMFQQNRTAESAFGAAIKAAFLAMKNTGGKLLVFQSVLPSIGLGALTAREAEGRTNISAGEKEANKLLQPADKTLKTMAIEFAEYQVCVDVFLTTQNYADIASISVVPKTTGGQVYYYYPFSALTDPAKLYNDLRWNVTRPQGFEAVMRVRCSQGLQVQDYSGNFCKRIPTDVDLPGIDCDKTIMVTLKHDDKLQDGSECSFQCALLYTTVYGQRRIRVTTLSLPCTTMLSNLFRSADLDSQFVWLMKQVAGEVPSSSLSQARDNVMNLCITILHAYRKFCATVSSSGQLILPEGLKLLPMYTLALTKSAGLRNEGRIDDRSYWVNYVSSVSTALAIPLVYPRMIAIHGIDSKDDDGLLIPPSIPLSSEHVSDKGIYLLENGEDALIYVGNTVESEILQQLFGISSIEELPTQYVPQQYDNPVSKKFNDVINEIRRQRCSYLRLRLCKNGDPSGMLFFSYLIEDKGTGLSYVEFLVLIHRQIQNKMN